MAEKTIQEIIKLTDHPLEEFFNVEPNSTEVVKKEQHTELVKSADYDEKDQELENQSQEIYDLALSNHAALQEAIEDIDPKWAARSHEVANQALQTALEALKEKIALKKHKDKLVKKAGGNTTNNTIFVDTNTLIQQLKRPKVIDAPAIDVTPIDAASSENKTIKVKMLDKSKKLEDREDFIKKYKAAHSAGLTIEQFAGYLGMTDPDSVNRRRLVVKESIGLDLPFLKRIGSKHDKNEALKEISENVKKKFQTELGKLTKENNKQAIEPVDKDDFSKYDGLLVTSAQNATPVHEGFLATALNYCIENNLKLVVIPYRYKNPTSVFQELEHEYWDPKIVPYLVDTRIKVFKNLQILGHIKKQATAVQPLYGLDAETGLDSAIVGHPKIQLRTVPTPSQTLPKIFTSTGAITLPNYTDSGAGWKGVTHHSYAAVVVEFDRILDIFHLRHVHADKDTGHFYDIDKFYTPNSAEKYGRASTLVTGDSHAIFMDPDVEKATYTNADSIVNVTNPENIVLHDVLDGYTISHHHKNNDVIKIGKHRFKMGNIEDELQITADFIDRISREDTKTYIVKSNHDEHLDRWLRECIPENDPENAQFYHWMKYHRAKNITQTDTGFTTIDPFIFWCNNPDSQRGLQNKHLVHILKRDESLYINGVEFSFHGDKGSNGSRGSATQFSKIGPKVVIGHSHSPQIYESAYQVGLSARMDLEYKSGCDAWMHAHALCYPDGKRTLLFIIKKHWRLNRNIKKVKQK